MSSWNQLEAVTAIADLRSSLETVLSILEAERHLEVDHPYRTYTAMELRYAVQALDVLVVDPTNRRYQRDALHSLDNIRRLLDPSLVVASARLAEALSFFSLAADAGYAAIVAAPDYKDPRRP